MNQQRGPTRIVLIRSGRYAYAELELHEPLHLIAGNNVGKTTLIAALQFLYIDDLRSMSFAQGPVETRRHYFPHLGSLVLFECLTPGGYQVVGARGLGPAQANEFERFVCLGEFDRNDYVDGRQVRTWEEIRRRLVAKDVYFPDARAYRASVLGTETKRPALDIVPLARSGSYENFRFLFRNLLHLAHVDERQLRSLLIDVAGPRISTTEIDLRKDYAELIERAQREARDVRALRKLEPSFARLSTAFQDRQSLRAALAARWTKITALSVLLRTTTDAECLALAERQRAIVETERPAAETARAAQEAALTEVNKGLGAIQAELDRFELLKKSAAGYLEEFENAHRVTLREECDALTTRLGTATTAVRADVVARINAVGQRVVADERAERAFERVAATWLRTNAGLPQAVLDDVFRVLNPALLGLVLEDSAVELLDPDALVGLLREVGGGFHDQGFRGGGVQLWRSALPGGSSFEAFADVHVIRDRLAGARRDAERLSTLLADVDQRDTLLATLEEARGRLEAAEARHRGWLAWREAAPREAGLREHGRELQAASDEAAALLRSATERVSAFAEELRKLEGTAGNLRRIADDQLARVRRLRPPPIEWEAGAMLSDPGDDLSAHVDAYRGEAEQHQLADTSFQGALSELEQATAGRYVRPSEAETLAALRDVRAALPNREAALEELWRGLVDGLGGSFAGLLSGAEEVHREVTNLNRALGKHRVSNLKGVEVDYAPDEGIQARIRTFLKSLEAPLLSSLEEHEDAGRQIADWMKEQPRVQLGELFQLRFRVTGPDGAMRSYGSLSQIESQGTSMTIKILLHVELLRKMMKDEGVALPYYVDEVGTFDDWNLASLIQHSKDRGFVPIFAGPDPKEVVPNVYVIRQTTQGLVLDRGSRVRIDRGAGDAA